MPKKFTNGDRKNISNIIEDIYFLDLKNKNNLENILMAVIIKVRSSRSERIYFVKGLQLE